MSTAVMRGQSCCRNYAVCNPGWSLCAGNEQACSTSLSGSQDGTLWRYGRPGRATEHLQPFQWILPHLQLPGTHSTSSIPRWALEHTSPRGFICRDVASPRGKTIHKILKEKQINGNMYTADLQVHIKSAGYCQSILMKVEKNLIWIGVSGDVFPLMQKKLSIFLKN